MYHMNNLTTLYVSQKEGDDECQGFFPTSSNCFYQHYGQMNTVRNNIYALSKDAPVKLSRREMHTGFLLE